MEAVVAYIKALSYTFPEALRKTQTRTLGFLVLDLQLKPCHSTDEISQLC